MVDQGPVAKWGVEELGGVVPTSEHTLESDFEQPSGWTERFVQWSDVYL